MVLCGTGLEGAVTGGEAAGCPWRVAPRCREAGAGVHESEEHTPNSTSPTAPTGAKSLNPVSDSHMQFCDDCGSMMVSVDGEMVCQNDDCGGTAERDDELADAFESTTEQTGAEVIETEADANFEGKPTATDVACDECGHGEAWYTIKQTGAADEPPTRFFKCKECGHRWRGYN